MTTSTFTESTSAVRWLGLATALGSVLSGGVLFAFSTFILPGLRRLPASDAIAAMQAINLQAPRSLFMLPLLGSAAGGVVLGVLVLVRADTPQCGLLLAGSAAAVATMVITAVYHVPHNDALAKLGSHDPHAAADWASYVSGWAAWNHVRTVTAVASAIALVAAFLRRA